MKYIIQKLAAGTLAAALTAACAAGMAFAEEPEDKTVYVITDASGAATKVINPSGSGQEDANELPIEIHTVYTLDGEEISPEELAGQSGHVTIQMEYDNHTNAPFAVITGMVLNDAVFSNIEITNGKLLGDESTKLAVGIAFPGLQESLDLQEDTLSIPEDFTVETDVQDFELEIVYSVALSHVFEDVDAGQLDKLEELTGSVTELQTALDEILNGAGDLSAGAESLQEGLTEIASHNEELTDGAAQVFEALLAQVQEQTAAAGLELEPLTIENYHEVLSGFDVDGILEQARVLVELKVNLMGDTLYTTYLEGQQEDVINTYLQENEEDILKSFLMTQVPQEQAALMTEEQIAEALSQQADALTEEEKEQILQGARSQLTEDEIAQIMAGAAQTLTKEQKAQIREGAIEQAMESEEVRSQIEAAEQKAAQLQAAIGQLDSFKTFYEGVISYTDGVQTAADGAGDLSEGAAALKDGLDQFNEEGIQVLSDKAENELQALADHIREALQQDEEYRYQDEEGQVKFIYKMGSISVTSE